MVWQCYARYGYLVWCNVWSNSERYGKNMKFIDQEETEKLKNVGLKIRQMKLLNQEILDFFIKDGEPLYESTQEILDIIKLYIKGENPDYIGEIVFQSDKEPIIKILGLFGIDRLDIEKEG